jgi:hypothetical protein
LSKQGNPLLRFLWCEAVGHAVRKDAELQRFYQHSFFTACVAGRPPTGV